MGFFSKIKEGLKKTRNSIAESVNSIVNSFTKIDEDFFEELEEVKGRYRKLEDDTFLKGVRGSYFQFFNFSILQFSCIQD